MNPDKYTNTNQKIQIGDTNRKTQIVKIQIGKIQIGEIQFGKYKSVKHNSEEYTSGIHFGKEKSGNTSRKLQLGSYKLEGISRTNTSWKAMFGESHTGKNLNREINIGKYNSENTHRETTNLKIHIGKYTSENRSLENIKLKLRIVHIKIGKCKSER